MNRLSIRLALAFGLVTAIAVLSVAWLANDQLSRNVGQYIVASELRQSPLIERLTDYYATHGGWAGVETVLSTQRGPSAGQGLGPGSMLRLTDASGRVVYDRLGQQAGAVVSRQELSEAIPLIWNNQPVGYLLFRVPGRGDLSGPAQRLLKQINQSLLRAGLIAGGIGIGLGIVISSGITTPLRRLAAAARQIAQGDLSQRVPVSGSAEIGAVARAFNTMAASLHQAEQQRQTLIADIAHELRTPLSIMRGNLQAILDDVYPLSKAEIAPIYDETLTLSRLINDLHELAQAEAGQLSLSLRPTEIAPIIEHAMALLGDLAAEKEIRLSAAIEPALPPVLADPDRLRQVLHNLLVNALRYTPAGGSVQVEAAADSHTGAEPAYVHITIRDSGPGIAAADLPHVFERFWRADRSRARVNGGSGLGLAIAKQLVEAQGGMIGVESREHHGSCFWVNFPVADVPVAA